jgi:chaperonin GroES
MIKPIRDNIVVQAFPSDEISDGGIFVSEAHREVSCKMKVIAVGNGTKKEPMKLKQGDVVFRVKGMGTEIEINKQTYFIVKQSWLIAQLN